MNIVVHTDGGARGNPGPAAVGIVIEIRNQKTEIVEIGKRIGETTNNVAEYMAVVEALTWLRNYPIFKLSNEAPLANASGIFSACFGGAKSAEAENASPSSLGLRPSFSAKADNPIIQFYLDSNLVVHQLNGHFKVKDHKLRGLLTQIRILEQEVGGEVHYSLIPREQNRRADFLVNQALDS